jgi:branched-chain amino acid transport system permease protein
MSAAKIGRDEWAEQEGDRRSAGPLTRLRAAEPVALAAILLAVGALLPLVTGDGYITRVAATACLYALLAVGLTVVVGFAGMLDLGYMAFFGVGAYAYALLASAQLGVAAPPWLALGAGVAAAGLAGALLGLPALRLRGDYLAVVTLGFAQAFVLLVLTLDRLELPGLPGRVNLTGGPNGVLGVPPLLAGGNAAGYLSLLVALSVTLALVGNLERSALGRGWRALRDDELAAASLGTPVRRLKLLAVVLGAAVAGLGGGLFSAWQGAIFPSNLDLSVLLSLYAAAILGGLGSLPGALVGALLLAVLPELLRDPQVARLLCYGVAAAALLISRPSRRGALALIGAACLAATLTLAARAVAAEPGTLGAPTFLAGTAISLCSGRAARPTINALLLIVGLGLLGAAFELRLVHEPGITRLLALGALLLWMLVRRPHGLLAPA